MILLVRRGKETGGHERDAAPDSRGNQVRFVQVRRVSECYVGGDLNGGVQVKLEEDSYLRELLAELRQTRQR